MSKKWLLSLGLAVLLIGATACGGAEGEGEDSASSGAQKSEQKKEQPAGPQPDLKGIPAVVAEVNGEEIPKADFVQAYEGQFQQMSAQSQASGEEVDQDQLKKQVVDNLIGTELLVQEANNRDFVASEKAVKRTLTELATQSGLKSVKQFKAALKKQGMAEADITAELETQVKVDQLIADEAGNIEPTEKEVKALYAQITAQQEQSGGAGGDVPPLGKVRPQLEEQVKTQKESQTVQALVTDFRKDADVKINL